MNGILGRGWTLDGKPMTEEDVAGASKASTGAIAKRTISIDQFRHVNSIFIANLAYAKKVALQLDPAELKRIEGGKGVISVATAIAILMGQAK